MVLNENVPWVDTIKNRNRRKLAINWLKSAIFGVRILRPILSLFQSIITNLYLFSFELCPFLVRKISFVEVSLPLNFVGCTWILLNLHCHQSPMVSGYTMQWKIKLNVINAQPTSTPNGKTLNMTERKTFTELVHNTNCHQMISK